MIAKLGNLRASGIEENVEVRIEGDYEEMEDYTHHQLPHDPAYPQSQTHRLGPQEGYPEEREVGDLARWGWVGVQGVRQG
jgi:hypothetical protein